MKARAVTYIGHAALSREVVETKTGLDAASVEQRAVAEQRELFLQPILDMEKTGIYPSVAIRSLIISLEAGDASPKMMQLSAELGTPSRATLHAWLNAYKANGRAGLLPKHTGRVRKDYGWEAAAIQIYSRPGKPSICAVARELREEGGFETATDKRVRGFIAALPAQLGDKSPMRIGRKKYNNTQKHYVHRTTANVPVGAVYQGDGHQIDVYLAHPETLRTWRAELVAWMDFRSRYIVGWALRDVESSANTIYALSRTLVQHDHVPSIVYIDNGSGYKSKMMTDEHTGYYERMGIETIFSLPGNPKSKIIERFWLTMERDFNQRFGDAYCGHGMASEVNSRFITEYNRQLKQWEKGNLPRMTTRLPTREEWMEKFSAWLEHYHNRPHPEDPSTTPAQLWATLERTPVHIGADALLRPVEQRKVVRGMVTHEYRHYAHEILLAWNGRTVAVEYDEIDDSMVTVRDLKGRMICDAPLVKKRDGVPTSRLEEARQRSTQKSIERLESKIEEKIRRAQGTLVADTCEQHTLIAQYSNSIEDNAETEQDNIALIDTFADDDSDISIDILSDDY